MTGPSPKGGRPRRRLSRSAEFERVYRQGRSKANRFLVLYEFPREGEREGKDSDDGPRLGVSVSRRVGGAVDRTRVKRALREAFWQEAERLPDGADYVVVARPDAKGLTEREGTPGVRRALGERGAGIGARRPAGGAAGRGALPADAGRTADPASADADRGADPASADADRGADPASGDSPTAGPDEAEHE